MPHLTTETSFALPYASLKAFCSRFGRTCPLQEDLDGTDVIVSSRGLPPEQVSWLQRQEESLEIEAVRFPYRPGSEGITHLLRNDFSWCGYTSEGFALVKLPDCMAPLTSAAFLGGKKSEEEQVVERITELLHTETGSHWEIISVTRYEEHWVAVGFQRGLVQAFLFGQTLEGQFVYSVAEKIIYPHSQSIWHCRIGASVPIDLVTYVVQYGGSQCNEHTEICGFHLDALRDYLLDHEPGVDILVTRFYGEREEGVGRYHKHQDGTFTVVFEEAGIGGLLQELNLPCQEHTEGRVEAKKGAIP